MDVLVEDERSLTNASHDINGVGDDGCLIAHPVLATAPTRERSEVSPSGDGYVFDCMSGPNESRTVPIRSRRKPMRALKAIDRKSL